MQGTFPFTYQGYAGMILSLQQNGYEISDYHNWQYVERPAILRHDIDNSPEKHCSLPSSKKNCRFAQLILYF